MLRLGVDTGGTFTDFVWLDEARQWQIHKQRSTPDDPSTAILTGIDVVQVAVSAEIVHGTTVATNALLERRGARTALITTKGFADVLAIGRQNRPNLYALVPQKPPPLVPKQWRFEVDERITAQGDVLRGLESAELQPIIDQLKHDRIESVAICLLFSFLHPQHEQQIAAALQSLNIPISLSSTILPEYREFERTATTVINAYVAPKMSHYLGRLQAGVAPRPLTVMQSSGGLISAKTAGDEAARTVLSGPAGGVVGAFYVAEQAGFDQIITFDMGGTSTDVALCPGHVPIATDTMIAGLPLRLPAIDIHTVGAGGGSIARVDAGGALHTGPQSAGADPGPACYPDLPHQQDKTLLPTVTDANLVLGRLDADHFLGGSMQLRPERSQQVIDQLAGAMTVDSAESAAFDVIRVANATMERAIRKISVERGYDPRLFTLVPFGGAGPLHACNLAASLQIPRVLIPPVPGVLSALGMLVAEPTKAYSQTVMLRLDGQSQNELQDTFDQMIDRAELEMVAEGYDSAELRFTNAVDMRYVGQSHELTIEAGDNLSQLFHSVHELRYGYRQPEADVEIVTARLTVRVPTTPPQLPRLKADGSVVDEAVIGRKTVIFDRQSYNTALFDRSKLQPDHEFTGPAIIFQYDTTIVIPPNWHVRVDPFGNLIAERV
jgi:N-methylhydantoinase A